MPTYLYPSATPRSPTPTRPSADRLCICLICAALLFGCAAKSKEMKAKDPRHVDPSQSVLIDARLLPDARIRHLGSKQAIASTEDDLDELREELCDGETAAAIFYQLIISREWHYYWLCSQKKPMRAMTKAGDKSLRVWLIETQKRAAQAASKCSAATSERIYQSQHDSGTQISTYCDGVILLEFPDGEKKTFNLSATRPTREEKRNNSPPASNSDQSSPSATNTPESRKMREPQKTKPLSKAKPCPQCRCPTTSGEQANSAKMCGAFGKRAFWQGVRKACDKICPALFKRCRSLATGKTRLCHDISETCATLRGICAR